MCVYQWFLWIHYVGFVLSVYFVDLYDDLLNDWSKMCTHRHTHAPTQHIHTQTLIQVALLAHTQAFFVYIETHVEHLLTHSHTHPHTPTYTHCLHIWTNEDLMTYHWYWILLIEYWLCMLRNYDWLFIWHGRPLRTLLTSDDQRLTATLNALNGHHTHTHAALRTPSIWGPSTTV